MQDFVIKYVFRALMEIIKKAVTEEQYRKLLDRIFDLIEDFIDKETSLDIADPVFKALIDQLRMATGVPDND